MKKLFIIFLIAIASTIVVTSCGSKTPLSEENKVFAGKWVSNDGTWLHIYNNGGGDLELSNTSVTRGTTTITDSTLKIGLMGIGTTFSLDEPPYEDDGQWMMELDGEKN